MTRTWIVPVLFFCALAGCNSRPGNDDRAEAPSPTTVRKSDPRMRIERPDVSRLNFDETTDTLIVYDLPDRGARWMVRLPDEPQGVVVQDSLKFRRKVDPKQVSVYYVVPNRGSSSPISLQEILEAHAKVIQ